MCGLAALLDRTGHGVDRAALARMTDRIASRGPDGEGTWVAPDGRAALAHRRLAIIDLSEEAAQPMASADGRLVVALNGELYNYRALRAALEEDGCVFRTASDTEVLLHGYRRYGADVVHRLRGMYAFVLWDAEKRGLLLARDPYGIKPLYVADDGRQFHAASQVKALLAGGRVDTAEEPAGHAGFFLWGHVPEPFTLYRGIRALPAGHSLWVDAGPPRAPEPFASIPEVLTASERAGSKADAREELRDALLDSVRHHLVADVPVGVFLSAGLDSATVAALAAESGSAPRTVTLGFAEYRGTANDEVPLAEALAEYLGAHHTTVWVTRDDFGEARAHVLDQMDQPTLDGVNTYFVSRAAREAGLKVALSGVGGDELFGGYPSFRQVPRLVRAARRVPVGAGRGVRTLAAPLAARLTSPKAAGLLEYGSDYAGAYLLRRALFMPWELPQVLGADFAREGLAVLAPRERLAETAGSVTVPALKVTALESCWYLRNQLLRDTDWAGMAHGVEVRTPLVDWTLLRRVAPLRAAHPGVGKQAMAATPARPLPEALQRRPKTGFQVPIRDWLWAGGAAPAERGLRGWARTVYAAYTAP
ncbi:MAG TPA: asparagine synthase (glutamine-hydrolyzing) [Rubricoccaceae bacterium]|nr:asparagine synthase (glutamine-hydrolyzing) [Rubricoccaceae bacterium]